MQEFNSGEKAVKKHLMQILHRIRDNGKILSHGLLCTYEEFENFQNGGIV